MNDKPKSFWKKSWPADRWFRIWLILLVATFFIDLTIMAVTGELAGNSSDWLVGIPFVLVFSAIVATVFLCLWAFLRWLCNRRNFKRFLFDVACLATLIALFYAEEDWRGKHDWEKFKHEREAKGERFDAASVIPPSVPDDQNFAMAPVFDTMDKLLDRKWRTQHRNPQSGNGDDQMQWDTNLVNPLEMNISENSDSPTNGTGNRQKSTMSDLNAWQQYYRTLAAKTNEFPVAPQPQTPAQDVLLALSGYDSTIEELRLAARRPYARFPLSYDIQPPAGILLPHLSGLKRSSQVLQLRAIAELQNGQSDRALADVRLMLRLSDSIRTEPFLISHLVSIAIANISLQPVWEGLVQHQWTDAQLAELDSELAKRDLLSDFQFAMRGELMLCEIGDIEYLRRFPEQTPGLTGNGDAAPPLLARILWSSIPNGWFYQNELRCARPMLDYYLPSADVNQHLVRPENVRRADATLEAGLQHANLFNLAARLFLPALGQAVTKSASGQESVDLARVAIALERYRLAHGAYPESLDALAPQFIKQIPHDLINGQPLHYHRTSDGQFVLYSVGWNETDDGGTGGFAEDGRVDIRKGDWVWRSSAAKN